MVCRIVRGGFAVIECTNSNRLLMQFHITGKCNLQCKHCYRVEGDVEPLSYKDIINVCNQFFDLRNTYNEEHKIKKRGHINITGGEPLIRKDIYDILQFLGKSNDRVTYGKSISESAFSSSSLSFRFLIAIRQQ